MDAVNSDSLLGVAVSRPFVGHKRYTGKWFGNFPSRLCLCWWKCVNGNHFLSILPCTLFGFVSHRSPYNLLRQLSSWRLRSGANTVRSFSYLLGATVLLDMGCHGLTSGAITAESSKISAVAPEQWGLLGLCWWWPWGPLALLVLQRSPRLGRQTGSVQ